MSDALVPGRGGWLRLALSALLAAAPAAAGQLQLVSRADPPQPVVTGRSFRSETTPEARYVAFVSDSPRVVDGTVDVNRQDDVFLYDRATDTLTLVSRSAAAPARTGSSWSDGTSLSDDGRYVAFVSLAADLVAGQVDGSGGSDAFLFDRVTATTLLVSRANGTATTAANGSSSNGLVSADGGFVAFTSQATNLVPGQVDTAGTTDVFLYERASGTVTLVSHAAGAPATAGNGECSPTVAPSADGRYVAYSCTSTDLVAGQTGGSDTYDVFLYDRSLGTSVLVSRTSASPTAAGGGSLGIESLSADGRYVLFSSAATDLVGGQVDTAGSPDLFLFDRDTGGTVLVSRTRDTATVTSAGSFFGTISGNGSRVLFISTSTEVVPGQVDANGGNDVFLYDRTTGAVSLVSRTASPATTANSSSGGGFLSADGSAVSFYSAATDLVAGQTGTGAPGNCFLSDTATGTVTLVSHAPGSPMAAVDDVDLCWVSGQGNHVLVASPAALAASPADLNGDDDVFVFDRATGANTAVSVRPPVPSATANGETYPLALSGLSADGRWLAFTSQGTNLMAGVTDANGHAHDLFLYDRVTATRRLVSHRFDAAATTADGDSAWSGFAMSADGRYLTFISDATNLIGGFTPPPFFWDSLFLYDRLAETTTLVSHRSSSPVQSAGGFIQSPDISADGRFIVWSHSFTVSQLVPGLTGPENGKEVVLHDRIAGTTTLVSHAAGSASTPGNGDSYGSSLSPDGGWVAFLSRATNLVAGQADTNSDLDLFLYDRLTGTATLVSRSAASPTTTGNASASYYSLSQDGRFVAYESTATDVVPGQVDTTGSRDIFLFDRATGTNVLVSHADGSAATAGNGTSFFLGFDFGSLSADGRYLVFTSYATNLVPGTDTNGGSDLFLYDWVTGTTTRVSEAAGAPGAAANGTSFGFISADGSRVLLNSDASDLMPGQVDLPVALGRTQDLFLWDRATAATTLVSGVQGSPTVTGAGRSASLLLSRDGRTVAFFSEAVDLAADDLNDAVDAFLFTATPPGSYFTLPPCRLIDTRLPQDGPALVSGVAETWTLHGFCGLPATARSVAVNVTVTQPSAAGHITLWAGDGPAPVASTLNFGAGQTRANNAILPLSATGNGTLAVVPFLAGGGTVHVLVDVVGWFE